MGWRIGDMGEEFNLLWADSYVPADTVSALNKYQKVAASTPPPPSPHRVAASATHLSETHLYHTHLYHTRLQVNHFPGMSELAKKNLLAKNLNRMIRALPGDFTFVPQTFSLPAELEPLRNWASSQKRKPTIILKPDAGCQALTLTLTLPLKLPLTLTLTVTLTLTLFLTRAAASS